MDLRTPWNCHPHDGVLLGYRRDAPLPLTDIEKVVRTVLRLRILAGKIDPSTRQNRSG